MNLVLIPLCDLHKTKTKFTLKLFLSRMKVALIVSATKEQTVTQKLLRPESKHTQSQMTCFHVTWYLSSSHSVTQQKAFHTTVTAMTRSLVQPKSSRWGFKIKAFHLRTLQEMLMWLSWLKIIIGVNPISHFWCHTYLKLNWTTNESVFLPYKCAFLLAKCRLAQLTNTNDHIPT